MQITLGPFTQLGWGGKTCLLYLKGGRIDDLWVYGGQHYRSLMTGLTRMHHLLANHAVPTLATTTHATFRPSTIVAMIVSQEPSRSQRHIRKTQDKAFPTVKEHRGVEGVRGPASIEKTVLELIERSGACMPNSRS